ncbi:MAG: DUF5689 domain-containing protein [Alistipes sp.]|jgi:hypothetical protein|nr:DUF5689 domain-containing protein [Alistipes sp.]
MKKILFLAAFAATTFALTGCYESYDSPGPWARYDDEAFEEGGELEDYELKTIAEVKAMFSDPGNTLRYLEATSEEIQGFTPLAPRAGGNPQDVATYSYFYPIEDLIAIEGKVVSNDAFGNFYRGLYIQDATGGIEIKVGDNGMFTKYRPGTTVYILCDGLVLGNYRSMLSLGLEPMNEDLSDGFVPYPNRFMEVPTIIDRHVKLGEAGEITDEDITVIGASQALTAAELYNLCGKLVRFEELTSEWVPYVDSYNAGYPQVFYKFAYNTYSTFNFQDLIDEWRAYRDDEEGLERPSYTHTDGVVYDKPEPENLYLEGDGMDYPSWGFKHHDAQRGDEGEEFGQTQDNFASAKFVNPAFDLDQDSYRKATELLVRTSGFSRFALEPVLEDGARASVTGIVQRYTDRRGNNIAFQIAVNHSNDIVEK